MEYWGTWADKEIHQSWEECIKEDLRWAEKQRQWKLKEIADKKNMHQVIMGFHKKLGKDKVILKHVTTLAAGSYNEWVMELMLE